MSMSTPPLALLLALALALALLAWWLARTRTRRHNRARLVRARRGEAQAERLLVEAGFTIIERQPLYEWILWIDGAPTAVGSRPDLIVERDGRRFVADVKTGVQAPDPARPAARRQLLEYLHVLEPDGLLLVDVDVGRIREVAFATATDRRLYPDPPPD